MEHLLKKALDLLDNAKTNHNTVCRRALITEAIQCIHAYRQMAPETGGDNEHAQGNVLVTVITRGLNFPDDHCYLVLNIEEEWCLFEHPKGCLDVPYDPDASVLYHLYQALGLFFGEKKVISPENIS